MPLMTIRAKRLSNAIIRNLITAQEFDDLVSEDGRDVEFADLFARPGQMAAVIASPTAMAAVAASPTARDAVNASPALAAIEAAGGRALVAWIVVPAGLNPDDYADMAAVAASPEALAAVAASPTAMAAVIASPTAMAALYDSPHIVSVPAMTSENTPSGLASASSEESSSLAAWKAFDSDRSSRGWATFGSSNLWLRYDFAEPQFIHTAELTGFIGNGTGRVPKDFRIEYSDNGSDWTTAFTDSNPANANANKYSFGVAGKHKHWRLFILNNHGEGNTEMAQLDFIGFAY